MGGVFGDDGVNLCVGGEIVEESVGSGDIEDGLL